MPARAPVAVAFCVGSGQARLRGTRTSDRAAWQPTATAPRSETPLDCRPHASPLTRVTAPVTIVCVASLRSFWFYGDDEPVKRLALLDSFLSEFDKRPVDSAVATQARTAGGVQAWGLLGGWLFSAAMRGRGRGPAETDQVPRRSARSPLPVPVPPCPDPQKLLHEPRRVMDYYAVAEAEDGGAAEKKVGNGERRSHASRSGRVDAAHAPL